MLSRFVNNIWQEAYKKNSSNILSLLEKNSNSIFLDVGCGDGKKTTQFANKINAKETFGIDGVTGRLNAAKSRDIKIKLANLEKKLPFPAKKFDTIVSNQVIEHVADIDNFISEISRLLKPGGYCIISTENLASWHNIFSLVLGFQDFSHHIIKKSHVANPLSPHHGEPTVTWSASDNSGVDDTAYPHLKILTYYSLIKVFEEYGFKFERGLASGYYPLFGIFANTASSIDPYHSHFIVAKFRKP